MSATPPHAYVHLTAGGVSVVLDLTGGRLPAIVHWGAALGDLDLADVEALAQANIEPPAVSYTHLTLPTKA